MADKMAVYGLRHTRSRLAGEIAQLEEWNRRNLRKIAELHARIAGNVVKISVRHAKIDNLGRAAMIGFEVELPAPVPRQTVIKRHFVEWGGVTRESLRQLKMAQQTPLTTAQIASAINITHELNLAGSELSKLRETVRGALKRLNNNGFVRRTHAADYPGAYSSWVLADIVD